MVSDVPKEDDISLNITLEIPRRYASRNDREGRLMRSLFFHAVISSPSVSPQDKLREKSPSFCTVWTCILRDSLRSDPWELKTSLSVRLHLGGFG